MLRMRITTRRGRGGGVVHAGRVLSRHARVIRSVSVAVVLVVVVIVVVVVVVVVIIIDEDRVVNVVIVVVVIFVLMRVLWPVIRRPYGSNVLGQGRIGGDGGDQSSRHRRIRRQTFLASNLRYTLFVLERMGVEGMGGMGVMRAL